MPKYVLFPGKSSTHFPLWLSAFNYSWKKPCTSRFEDPCEIQDEYKSKWPSLERTNFIQSQGGLETAQSVVSMARHPRVNKISNRRTMKKGAWSAEEDRKLVAYIMRYGIWNWTHMAEPAGQCVMCWTPLFSWSNFFSMKGFYVDLDLPYSRLNHLKESSNWVADIWIQTTEQWWIKIL